MSRICFTIFILICCVFYSADVFAGDTVTREQVINQVNTAAAAIEKNAPETIKLIINGVHPYKDKDNPAFYIFVYDTDVNIMAHPKNHLVGRSYKGKPDVRGKKFRDEIVNGAVQNGTGWVDYSYQKPGEKGIHKKTTYYKMVTGSDGLKYVVCSGKYAD